jgi:hypothetical protein
VEFFDPVGDVPLLNVSGAGSSLLAKNASAGASDSTNVAMVEMQKGYTPITGTFLLSYDGYYTDNLDFQASENGVKRQLEKLPTIDEVDVHRSATSGASRTSRTSAT